MIKLKRKSLKKIKEEVNINKYGVVHPTKKEVKHGDKNILIKLLVLFIIVLVFLVAYISCCFVPLFNIKSLNISKTKNYTTEEIKSKISKSIDSNILRFSSISIEHELKKLPYIKKVDVVKYLPSTLEIEIEEYSNKYILKLEDGKFGFISEENTYLGTKDTYEFAEDEYYIEGIKLDEKSIKKLDSSTKFKLETADKISKKFKERIKNFKFTKVIFENNEIKIVINDKITVKLPSSDDYDYEMRFLNQILQNVPDKNGYIDMTKDNPYYKEIN